LSDYGTRTQSANRSAFKTCSNQRLPGSEQRKLPLPVIKDRTAVQRRRNRVFVRHDSIEVGLRLQLRFHHANEALEAAKAVELVLVAELCFVQ
jgi:hypothetical protein